MSGMDKIHTQDEYENAQEGDMDLSKKIIKLDDLNELLAFEDLILSIKLVPLLVKWPLDK